MWYDIEVRLDSHGFNINVKKYGFKDGHQYYKVDFFLNLNITFRRHCEFTMGSKMFSLLFIMI